MDEDRIGLVLAKTSELRSKIISCIHKTSKMEKGTEKEAEESEASPAEENQEGDEEEEAESLLNIRDALESLEGQLFSLQALQQQQWYEKEAALAEIEYSQKKLLKELKEYEGKELEVIHEAIAFASETEENSDLLLPPYPSRPSRSDNGYLSSFPSTHKFTQNGTITGVFKNLHDASKTLQDSDRNQGKSEPAGPFRRLKFLLGAMAKTTFTVMGVIAILSLAGFEPRLKKVDDQFKLFDLLQLQRNDKKRISNECPPGKVPVMENGEVRCIVKERVEIPFESVVSTPNVSYGCG